MATHNATPASRDPNASVLHKNPETHVCSYTQRKKTKECILQNTQKILKRILELRSLENSEFNFVIIICSSLYVEIWLQRGPSGLVGTGTPEDTFTHKQQ